MTKVPKAISLRPGNRQCADCRSLDPRWASVNLGLFICEACAGIHRNLGTHISQVRSVTLDDWKAEWIAKVHQVGNDRAKAYYEHSVPAGEHYTGQVDLVGGDTLNPVQARLLEQWIRAKYEERRFAPEGQRPPCEKEPDCLPSSPYPCSQEAVKASPWPTGTSARGDSTANTLPWDALREDATRADLWPAAWPTLPMADPWHSEQWACASSPSADSWAPSGKSQLPPERTAVNASWHAEKWPEPKQAFTGLTDFDRRISTLAETDASPNPQNSSCLPCIGSFATGLREKHWFRSQDYKPLLE